MPKTLKVTFSGVCTFAPRIPDGDPRIDKLFVLMPAARSARLGRQLDPDTKTPTIVGRHHAYVYVPDNVLGTVPEPAILVRDEKLGLCNVYLIDRARISFGTTPENELAYFRDPANRPVKGRPNSANPGIAPPNDSRWLPDVNEVFPKPVRLRGDVDPRKAITNDKVSMVVEVTGGLIEASHPCNTNQPRTFVPPLVSIPPRIMTSELTVTMKFRDDATSILLKIARLDPNERFSGLPGSGLELFWRTDTIHLRIGNDTLDEIVAIRNSSRCAPPPHLPKQDADFDLHYDLLAVEPSSDLPLPTRTGDQGDIGGCVGLTVFMPE